MPNKKIKKKTIYQEIKTAISNEQNLYKVNTYFNFGSYHK
jgi:hypothetical protein